MVFLFWKQTDLNDRMQHPGGVLLMPGWTGMTQHDMPPAYRQQICLTVHRWLPNPTGGLLFWKQKESKNEMHMSGGHMLAAGLDGGNSIV